MGRAAGGRERTGARLPVSKDGAVEALHNLADDGHDGLLVHIVLRGLGAEDLQGRDGAALVLVQWGFATRTGSVGTDSCLTRRANMQGARG